MEEPVFLAELDGARISIMIERPCHFTNPSLLSRSIAACDWWPLPLTLSESKGKGEGPSGAVLDTRKCAGRLRFARKPQSRGQ